MFIILSNLQTKNSRQVYSWVSFDKCIQLYDCDPQKFLIVPLCIQFFHSQLQPLADTDYLLSVPIVLPFHNLFFLNTFFFTLIFIGVQLIYNVVLVSAVQQSESAIHTHISTLFQILFPYRSLQNTEKSSLCYTVGPCCLTILYVIVFIY